LSASSSDTVDSLKLVPVEFAHKTTK
jgi:hypothetical protein